MDFTGKQVLITGASRGIGYATAKVFLALGARVAVNGRTEQSVATAITELGGGDHLVAAPGSVRTVDGGESIVRAAIEGLGGLDILVNNAGVSIDATIENTDEALWDETLDVNLKGTFFCVRAALPALRKAALPASKTAPPALGKAAPPALGRSGSAIINMASVDGLQGTEGGSAYCASKGGVVNLTRAMAIELAPEIRVNCVCPGWVDTDMLRRDYVDLADDPAAAEREVIEEAPLKRVATPEEVAKAIAYLASHDARFITGVALPIDGGISAGY